MIRPAAEGDLPALLELWHLLGNQTTSEAFRAVWERMAAAHGFYRRLGCGQDAWCFDKEL